ncbi:hypothetical protein [Rhodovulum sp. MB263]|uniref:hypothetical protein n=1 Tax=Rhodovulum sp. (strain MB263) TaxID=308754 RepID=UPI0009B721F5|nr:hypothetical protein [Rhodovulum sp. MB263]ARC90744.1 hypothetical protein B5V46_18885 [Rhodovulum sp. MB263]
MSRVEGDSQPFQPQFRRFLRQALRSTTALAAVLSLGAAAAGAGTLYWSGQGDEGIWADPENWADGEDNPIEGDAPGLDGVPVGVVLKEAATGPLDLETGRATLSALELTGNSDAVLTNGTLTFALPDDASETAARLTVAGSGGFMDETLAFVLEDDLLVEASVDTGLAGDISGAGALRLRAAGDSEITLSGTNSQTGGTVIEAGTVVATGGAALSDGGSVTLAGGIDGRAASVLRIEQDETVGGLASAEGARGGLELAGGSLTVAGGPALSFGLAISGSGGLTVGDGTDLTLGAANSYAGGTRVSGGALTVAAGGNLGSGDVSVDRGSLMTNGAALSAGQNVTLGSGGLWTLAGDETVGGLDGTGTADLGGNRLDIALSEAETLAFGGSLKGSSDSLLALTGGGDFTLSGPLSDYRGGFRIEAGRLGLSDAGGALNDNALTLAGGTLVADLSDGFGGSVTTEAGSESAISAAAGSTLSLTGAMALSGDLSFSAEGEDAVIGLDMASVTLEEGVSLGFDLARFEIGSEAAAGMFAAAQGTRLGAGAALDLAGYDVGIRALTGSGRILTDSGDALLSLGEGTDFGGVLADGAAGRLSLETDGTVRLTGDNSLTGGTSVTGGSLTLAGGGRLGDIEIASAGRFVLEEGSAGAVVNSGTGSSNAGTIASLTQKEGSFGNSGTIGGAVSVEGGSLSNEGRLSGDVSVGGGRLDNTGSIGGSLDVTGGTASNSGSVEGKSTVGSGGVLVSEGGQFGDDLTIEGDTGSGEGTLRLSGTTTVAGDVTNDGRIETRGGSETALTLTDGGGFTNNGRIAAEDGALTVTAGTITISDGASMSGDIDFVGTVVNKGELDLQNDLNDTLRTDTGGRTRIVASLDGAGHDVENAGSLELGAGLSFTGIGEVSNSGTVEIGAGGRLEAGRIGNAGTLRLGAGAALEGTGNTLDNSGTITVGDGASVTDAGAIENREGGLIEFTGSGSIAADSDQSGDEPIRNAGRIVTDDGGDDVITLGGATPNVLENTATGSLGIGASDSMIGAATTLENAGTVTIGVGSTLKLAALDNSASGSVTNDGRLEADTVTSAGRLTNNAGAEIAADVSSSGTLENAGTISGDLSVTGGTARSSGSLQDVTVSDGTLTVTAGSLTGLTVSGGSASLEGGALSGDLAVSGGAADVDVAVGGSADVTGGRLGIGADGSVAGQTTVGSAGRLETAGRLASLSSAGQADNSGTITGDVTVTGGRTDNSGTIGGSVAASGGSFLSSGTVSGDVAATGGALASVSGRIDGALTAGSGSEARVTGDLALGGGLGIADGGRFDLQSGRLTLADGTAAVNDGSATIGAGTLQGGTFRNRDGGQLNVSAEGRLEADLVNAEGAQADIDGTVTGAVDVTGGRLEAGEGSTLSGGLAVSGGSAGTAGTVSGGVSVTGGRYDNSGSVSGGLQLADGAVGNSGTIGGAVSVEGGSLSNEGRLSGNISVGGGRLDNTGSIGGSLDVTGGTASNSGSVEGKSTVGSGGVLVSEGGQFGDDLTIEGDTGSGEGTLRLSGTTTVAGDVTNDGRIETRGGSETALTLTDGGGFTNNGRIAAEDGALTVTAGTITISDGASMSGDIDFVGTVVNKGELDLQNDLNDTLRTDTGGRTRIVASLDGAGHDVENAGSLELGAGLSFTGIGEVSNSGTVEIGAGGRLEAGRIGNAGTLRLGAGAALEGTGNTLDNSGTITVGDGASVTDAGAIENREGGLIEFTGSGSIAADSDQSGDEPIRNAGRIVTDDGGDDVITLGGATPNVLENTATGSLGIGASDSMIGAATTLENAGTVTIGVGSTLKLAALDNSASGSVTNDGRLEADTVTSAGRLTNNAGAEIAADVSSSGTLENAGTISGDLSVTGGTARSSGSLQDVTVSDGTLTVTAGSLTGLTVSGGSASLEGGALSGDLAVSGGAADVDVAVGGSADVTGGRLGIGADGSVAGQTTVGSAGRLETAGRLASLSSAGQADNSGTITGDVTVTGGRTDNSGTIGGSVAASGGSFLSSGTVSGDVAATGGALASVSGRIDGALTAGSGSEARVTGDLALGGGLGIADGGRFDLQSGRLTLADGTAAVNDGSATIGAGTLQGGTFRNRDGGQLNVSAEGRLEADLVNAEGAQADIDGTVAGAVDNDGEIALGGTIDGTLANDGTLTVAADDTAAITGAISGLGSYLVAGSLDFGGSFDLGSPGRASATGAQLSLGENATVTGDLLTSYGSVTLADGSRLASDLVSYGQLRASGSATIDGDLTLSDGAVLSLADGTTGDRLDVTGDAELNGTIAMDIDLTDGAQSADAIYIDGVASGSVVLAFNDLTAGDYGQIRDRLDLLSYGSDGGLSVRSTGLPGSGSILYRLDRNDAGDGWGLISGANPAFGGLASGLALTQSLIGSVVNRPTSPYVSGLASTEGSPCGWGSWGRAMGGKATASGNSHTALGSFSTEIDASYGGVQAGLDYSCFDGGEDGWNLSFGTIFGLNDGSIKQPVYLFDPDTGTVNQGIQTSRNHTDFQQLYGGAYVGASKGRFFADLQVTVNQTDFDLENRVASGAYGERLGVDDQSYESTGHTVSGTMGYAFPLGEDSGFSLIPSLGFSISRTRSDDLYFSNDPADDSDDGVLKFDPITNEIGFASLTLSRSRVLPSGVAVLNGFATATAYHDFSDRSVAKYYELDASGAPLGAPLLSENDGLGNYGELSAGFNYTRVFGKGQAGAARQMDASVRVDSRFGDDLEGWGVTAQMRFQF